MMADALPRKREVALAPQPGIALFTSALVADMARFFNLDLPRTQQGVDKWVKRAGIARVKAPGSKALLIRKCDLPEPLLNAYSTWEANTAHENAVAIAQKPARVVPEFRDLDNKQRAVMDARLAVLRHVHELEATVGRKAIALFMEQQERGELPAYVVDAIPVANAKSAGAPTVKKSSLYEWRKAKFGDGATALATRKAKLGAHRDWHSLLLDRFQRSHQKQSISKMVETWSDYFPDVPAPTLRRAQDYMKKVPDVVKNWRRFGPNARRKFGLYIARDTGPLRPMDVVTADGHLLKAYARNPDTGKRMRVEVSICLDVKTRRAVGFSLWHAESQEGVRIALTQMFMNPAFGIPAIFYTDNGPGYKGQRILSVLDRVGCTPRNSLPYNAQARGLIERFNSAVLIPFAKEYDTYCGDDCDQEHLKKALKIADTGGSNLPTLEQLYADLAVTLDRYNNRPHRSLGNRSPIQVWDAAVQEHGFEPVSLATDDFYDLLPSYERVCRRGVVQLPWGTYFAKELAPCNGWTVRVHVVPNDGSRVWVVDPRGNLICVAERDGNVRPYFSEDQREHASEVRAQGQLKRLQRHIDAIEDERRGSSSADPLFTARLEHTDVAQIGTELNALNRATEVVDRSNVTACVLLFGKLVCELADGIAITAELQDFYEWFENESGFMATYELMKDDIDFASGGLPKGRTVGAEKSPR